MGYKTRPEDESPLWRRYMDELDGLGPAEQGKWTKSVDLGIPFPSKTFAAYSEDEFLEKIRVDEEFNRRWGQMIKS